VPSTLPDDYRSGTPPRSMISERADDAPGRRNG